jgi:hypothetical protein
MFYMSWVRIRSIRSPKSYSKELLNRKPHLVMLGIWFMGLCIWTPTTFAFGTIDYTLDVNFRPYYLKSIFNFVTWFIPLFSVLVLALCIIANLVSRHHRRRALSRISTNDRTLSSERKSIELIKNLSLIGIFRSIKSFDFRAQLKFIIIISTYWIQWV